MAKRHLPSPEYLRQRLRYEPETGKLFWRECASMRPQWNARYAGKEAFAVDHGNGYRSSTICNQRYYAHRVIWALHHGVWPKHQIDHINGVRHDNRLANLREATSAENSRNTARQRNNTSGVKGVSLFKATGRWEAYISPGKSKKKHLGFFATKEEAAAAYEEAARQLYGEFARLA